MKNQIRLPRKIALRFELIFLKLSSASDWIICTKECELIKSGHTFGLLAVNRWPLSRGLTVQKRMKL